MKKFFIILLVVILAAIIFHIFNSHSRRSKIIKQQQLQKQQQFVNASAENNLDLANEFLASNRQQPGVVSLANGLQYKVITKGSGARPDANNTVVVDYEGKLLNKKVFDSSYKRGQPASFQVGEVIKGWQQALQLMRVGATWELYIPPQLAYGAHGYPPVIGPNELLIFKVHLIAISNKS